MKKEGREFPQSLDVDIQNSQIARFRAKWERISHVKYLGEGLERLRESDMGIIRDYLIIRGNAIGKAVAPNDQDAADNTSGYFILGALFMDEVMNTVPQFNHTMNIEDLKKLAALKKTNNLTDEYPLMEVNRVIGYVSPNLKVLMDYIVGKLAENNKFNVATGLIEMYALKSFRSDVFLRALMGLLTTPDSFKNLIRDLDLEGI